MTRDDEVDTVKDCLPPTGSPPGPASPPVQVGVGARSHRGHVRPHNEDCYLVARLGRSLEVLLTNVPAGHVPDRHELGSYAMLVADGVGGMAAGDVASRLAASTLVDLVLTTPDWIVTTGDWESECLLERIVERYARVNDVLTREARSDPALAQMATTMTLAFNVGAELFLGHVGDSRAYLHRGGRLQMLTRDHTMAQGLADLGVIHPEEVATHRLRHVLTRVLGGSGRHAEADVHRLRLEDGDQVLLCTDGLTGMAEDAAIAAVLEAAGSAAAACDALVDLALNNGGKDNVTVVVARYRFGRGPAATATPTT